MKMTLCSSVRSQWESCVHTKDLCGRVFVLNRFWSVPLFALAYISKPPRDQFSYISVLIYIQSSNVAQNSTLGCPTSWEFTELTITARTQSSLYVFHAVGPKECAILIFCPLKTTTLPPFLPLCGGKEGGGGLLELQALQPHCSLGAFPATGTDSTGASSGSPLAATKVYVRLLTNERP